MLFSNLPPVLATQEFARERSDMLAAARDGKVATGYADISLRQITEYRPCDDSPITFNDVVGVVRGYSAPIIDISNQTGSTLTVEPLREPFKIGTVFNIEGVRAYDATLDDQIGRDFIVTMTAEVGQTCIRIYPPIEVPRTVVALPQKGARLIMRPECDGVPMPRS